MEITVEGSDPGFERVYSMTLAGSDPPCAQSYCRLLSGKHCQTWPPFLVTYISIYMFTSNKELLDSWNLDFLL